MTLNLIRRLVKGTPLTAAEHDGNLDKLEDAIEARPTTGQQSTAITAAVAAHVAAADAHPGYLTPAEGDAAYATAAQGALASTAIQPGNSALSDAREWTAATIEQAEAEAGTATTRRAFTAQRVRQAIAAWWAASTDKAKLDAIAAGAEVNVNADWNASSGDAQILNKPTLGTAAALDVGTGAGNVVQLDSSARLPAVDGSQLTGLSTGGTNLSYDAQTREIRSSTGTDAILPEATTTVAGLQSAADKTRIDQLGETDSPSFTGLTITGTAPVNIPHIHGSIAGNFYIHVRNDSGGQLTAGTAVYAIGSVGDTDRIRVAACDPTDPAKMPAIGILETTLAQNGDGDAVILGELRPFNTGGYALGDELYVGAGGALVATIPASGQVQHVGSVARVNSNTGTIVVGLGASMARVGFTGAYGDLSGLPTIPSPADAAPQPLGATAAIGTSTEYAREDHVHARSTYADLGPLGDGLILVLSNKGETATAGTNYVEWPVPVPSGNFTLTAVRFGSHIDNTGSSSSTFNAYKRTDAGTKTSVLTGNATLASGASLVDASASLIASPTFTAGDRIGVDLVGVGTGAQGLFAQFLFTRSAV